MPTTPDAPPYKWRSEIREFTDVHQPIKRFSDYGACLPEGRQRHRTRPREITGVRRPCTLMVPYSEILIPLDGTSG